MKCVNCGAVNPDGMNFCKNCGKRLIKAPSPADNAVFCGYCGLRADEDALFCTGCGRPFFERTDRTASDRPLKTLPMINKYIGNRQTGITQVAGRMLVLRDCLIFQKRIGSSVGAAIGNTQSLAVNGQTSNTEVYPIAEIASCVYAPYALQMPAMVLTMKNGQTFHFSKAQKEQVIRETVALVNELMHPASAVRKPARAASPETNREFFRFVMPIENFVAIEDYGTAIIGEVQTGSVAAGDTIHILGEDNQKKGSFEVRSVAVNKKIAPRAFAGSRDVALLLFCPPAFIKSGDKACF